MIGHPTTDCQSCSKEFVLCYETALVVLYTYQSQYDNIQMFCPYCGEAFYGFITEDWAINFLRRGIPLYQDEFAPYHIVKGWHAVRGLKLLRRKRLSRSEHSKVQTFRDELGEINDFGDWLRKLK